MTQGNLFDEACQSCKRPAHPGECIPTGAPSKIRKRVGKQALAILEVLRKGPATGPQFAAIAMQYNARIFDLRKAGYTIEITKRNDESGNNTYELKGEPTE